MVENLNISQTWQDWIEENLKLGCAQNSMVDSMVKADFSQEVAMHWIGAIAKRISSEYAKNTLTDRTYIYEHSKLTNGNTIVLSDQTTVSVLIRLSKPDMALFSNFMSHDECDMLIEYAKQKLAPSTIVDPLTGTAETIKDRTSIGAYFSRGENEFINKLEIRISELMNHPLEYGEGVQVLNYEVGKEYKAHFDYFAPQESGSIVHLANGGQRVATLVMYLNDVECGGETFFPDIGLSVVPKKGYAAYFAYGNSLGQVDPLSLHAGAPVARGEKWIATKWVRQRFCNA
ncbi:MAG: hypothetical protein RL154_106 [Pseudomonadota bacterium]|jgi:prolyl 4-hydroxylase